MGMVNRVVDHENLLAEAQALAAEFAGSPNGPTAVHVYRLSCDEVRSRRG